jgi:hypothetical protein
VGCPGGLRGRLLDAADKRAGAGAHIGSSNAGLGRSESSSTSYREVPMWRAWEIAQLAPYRALYLQGWRPQILQLVKWEDRLER